MSRHTSVQAAHIALETIEDDVLCLVGGEYRAVLEAGTVNFGLQGEAEQEVVVASFASFLNSLTFPVQILVRVLPIDLEGYLARLEGRTQRLPDELADLARDYAAFLRRLARNRTLLERRCYVVVPAQPGTPGGSAWVPPVAGLAWPRRRRPRLPGVDAARRQLTFRCEEVERQLSRCGLTTRRLNTRELTQLAYACWCPELAGTQRLVHLIGPAARPAPTPTERSA